MLKKGASAMVLGGLMLALAACAPAAAPVPTPTKAPAAAPTKAPEAAKPPAPAPTPPPAPTPTPKPATVKFGGVQAVSEAGVFIGLERGYFKEQGITIEVNNFRSIAELIAPLGTGQLDVIFLPISVPLLSAADRGVELKLVAGTNQFRPKWENAWVLLRKDLKDSGQVKTPADLKGMKVAIPSLGSQGEMIMQRTLEQGGLKPGEAEVVVLAFDQMAAGFANKAIASAWATEPYVVRSVEEGFAIKWIPTSQFFAGKGQGGFVVFGAALLKDQDLARRWMIAYLKAVRDYLKAFSTGEGRQEVVNTLIKSTPIKEAKLYDAMEVPYLDPNGAPDKDSMYVLYKWFVEKGLYTGKKTFEDVLDLSHADYAAQKLGKQ